MSAPTIVIAFPTTAASSILGRHCISNLYNVVFFMPSQIDVKFGKISLQDLKVIAASCDIIAEQSVDPDFSRPDIKAVFFPCIDYFPEKERTEYGTKVKHLFKDLKGKGMKFNKDSKIVFGRNVAGLIAAREMGFLYPEMRSNVLVVSSVFYASKKVFGIEGTRAFPMQEEPGLMSFIYAGEKTSTIVAELDSIWALDDHTLIEAAALSEVLNLIKDAGGDFSELEIIGRFPNDTECTDLSLDKTSPVWLPTSDKTLGTNVVKELQSLSKWLRNDYQKGVRQETDITMDL